MKLWMKVAVSAGLLVALVLFVPWDQGLAALSRLSPIHWVLVVLGFLFGHLIGVTKWRLVVTLGRTRFRLTDAVMCYFAGLFANILLPSIVGGDVLRAALAARVTRSPEAAIWGGVTDRLTDLVATALMVAVGLAVARAALPGAWENVATAALLTMAACALLALPFVLRRPLARWPRRLRRSLGRSLVSLRRLSRARSYAIGALTLSLAVQSIFVLLNASLGSAVGVAVPLAVWFLVWPLAKLSGLLPISLGGLAVREATLAALLVPFGVPASLGIVAALLWQTVLISGALAGGLVWLILSRRASARAIVHGAIRASSRASSPAHG
jgi:hypothetical protein